MKNTLVDAGPLIALFDKDDRYHAAVKSFLKEYKGDLITSWPVITEVTQMLSFSTEVQIDFLEWLNRDALNIVNIESIHLTRIIELTKKYSDMPMDLADSSLIVIAEMKGLKNIATIDSDYYIYRARSKKYLNNILEKYLQEYR
ncbi:MAG TPA: PIN domain-containing protein [Spirochaetota bacterium]|nr:PIN domain-containing protein [Spirochaetota bacterium]HPJ40529.1 PIN domain-containing protein [Spirochaetota bacterium]